MSTPTPTNDLDARIRVMQIILGAIVLGAVAFLVVAVVVRWQSDQPAPESPIISYIALGTALVIAVAYYFVTDALQASQRRGANTRIAWCNAYQTTMIAGAAMLEGAVFFLLIAYLLEGNLKDNWTPLVAALGFIVVIVTLFPTRSGLERWIAEQQEKLKQEQAGR
ncbi:MAG TPA: hypothetical protein VNK04_10130 [Gemmataceae bacterium]|nr:hypothetical protein [Gemmataceae bacterium]